MKIAARLFGVIRRTLGLETKGDSAFSKFVTSRPTRETREIIDKVVEAANEEQRNLILRAEKRRANV